MRLSERYKAICQLFWAFLKNPDRYYILEFLLLFDQAKSKKTYNE